MLLAFILAAPAFAIRYYLGRPVSKLYAIAGIAVPYVILAWLQLRSDPQASTMSLSAGAVIAYFTLIQGDEQSDPSDLPTVGIDDLTTQMWTYNQGDLTDYEDLEWMCSHTGKEYRLGQSEVFLNDPRKQLLVRPHNYGGFSVICIKGIFNQRLVTVARGPSRKYLHKNLERLYNSDVVPSGINVP